MTINVWPFLSHAIVHRRCGLSLMQRKTGLPMTNSIIGRKHWYSRVRRDVAWMFLLTAYQQYLNTSSNIFSDTYVMWTNIFRICYDTYSRHLSLVFSFWILWYVKWQEWTNSNSLFIIQQICLVGARLRCVGPHGHRQIQESHWLWSLVPRHQLAGFAKKDLLLRPASLRPSSDS